MGYHNKYQVSFMGYYELSRLFHGSVVDFRVLLWAYMAVSRDFMAMSWDFMGLALAFTALPWCFYGRSWKFHGLS